MQQPIIFRPRFSGSILQSSDERIAHLQSSWLKLYPDAPRRPGIDFEDWVENAVRLDAAFKMAPERLALLHDNGRAYYPNGREVPAGSEVLFLGTWHNQDDEVSNRGVFSSYRYPEAFHGETALANRYMESRVFQDHAGRVLHLCGIREEPTDQVDLDLYECLAQMFREGHRQAFVKVSLPKYAISRFELTSDDPKAISQSLFDQDENFGWTAVHLGGRNNMFLVQEYVPMAYEYRVIVVNHHAVAGAGCVEVFTPLDNEAQWDPKMEFKRSSGMVEHQHAQAEAYMHYARGFTQAYQVERPSNGNYTLDLAVSNGRILAIELNPLQNYGLYAMDFEAILAAQLAH